MTKNGIRLPVLAKLFSAETFRGLSYAGGADIRAILDAAAVPGLGRRMRITTIFDKAFAQLLRGYRCEYVYKNQLTAELLLRRHNLGHGPDSARLLTEFWVDDVRADLAVINGTSSVYEVKTSLDTLARMPRQLDRYSQFFDKIYVVTSEEMLAAVEKAALEHVGIQVMSADGSFAEYRTAHSNKANVDRRIVFRSMRELEALDICREVSGLPLDMANGLRSDACWEIFRQMSPMEAHDSMVRVIRKRKIHAAQQKLVQQAPISIKHLCIGKALNVTQYRNIANRLQAVV